MRFATCKQHEHKGHICVPHDDAILICAAWDEKSTCVAFDGTAVSHHSTLIKEHFYGAMVVYDQKPTIIAGGYSGGNIGEIYEDGNWIPTSTIPLTTNYYHDHSAAVINGKVYTFGGYARNNNKPEQFVSDRAGVYEYISIFLVLDHFHFTLNSFEFDGTTWSKIGGLLKKRHHHRSVVIGLTVYHVAGATEHEADYGTIEKWETSGDAFTKTIHDYAFTDGSRRIIYYPELIMVRVAR